MPLDPKAATLDAQDAVPTPPKGVARNQNTIIVIMHSLGGHGGHGMAQQRAPMRAPSSRREAHPTTDTLIHTYLVHNRWRMGCTTWVTCADRSPASLSACSCSCRCDGLTVEARAVVQDS